MPAPSATWSVKRVYATYRNRLSLAKEPGTWTATASGRIVNTLADGSKQIFRAGEIGSGTLNTTEGVPSLILDLPVTDDPDNSPQGGAITLTIVFASGGTEVYQLSPLLAWPADPGTDLATLADPAIVPSAPTYVMIGVPGGVAALDADGDVVDADGVKVVAGGGSGAVASVAGKTGVVTLVKADVGLSNVDNTSDANKPVGTAAKAYGYSKWNASTSMYEPVRDASAAHWTYKSPAGAPPPNNANGGAGRQDQDSYLVKPNA